MVAPVRGMCSLHGFATAATDVEEEKGTAVGCVNRCAWKGLRTWLNHPVRLKGQPRIFKLLMLAHAWSCSLLFSSSQLLPEPVFERQTGAKDSRERAPERAPAYGNPSARALPGFLVVLILAVVFHPMALAIGGKDGWLRTSLAQERLDAGDEFGC